MAEGAAHAGRDAWLGVHVRRQDQVAPDRQLWHGALPARPLPATRDAPPSGLPASSVRPALRQPGEYKLGEWLADLEVIAMLKSDVVRSLTFKETFNGPNITKNLAIQNSANWTFTAPSTSTLDDLPTCDDFGTGDGADPSSASSASASTAASPAGTPGKRVRRF